MSEATAAGASGTSAQGDTPAGRDAIVAAQGFADELRRRAAEIEQARRIPQDLSDRFAAVGLYATCVPEAYGGLELTPADTARVIEHLAQADGSAAWCVFIGATSGSALATLPEDSARAIFSRPDVRIAGVFAPRGRAVHDGDGFRASGRWPWGSGTQNSDFVLAGCLFESDGEIERLAGGAPRAHMVLVPALEVTFHDTWHTSGLCGTGSTDFELIDVSVPADRVVGLLRPVPIERPLYAFPMFGLLALGIAAVALGLARASIAELIAIADGKHPAASRRTLAERHSAQADVAEAEALLRSARAFFYEAIEGAWACALASGSIPVERRRDLRLSTTHAVRSSARAVDLMYTLAGGTSVYRESPLQRIFRDVHVATQHMMVAAPTMDVVGRLLLGLETDVSQL
ncbi:MAG: acyl-CoA dehydrogenase family protein [Candidatus Binatia bacterium]